MLGNFKDFPKVFQPAFLLVLGWQICLLSLQANPAWLGGGYVAQAGLQLEILVPLTLSARSRGM